MTAEEHTRFVVQLVEHEGCRLKPYRDTVGQLTIGVGRNLTANGITHDEALYLLANDIAAVEARLIDAMPWVVTLNATRRRVLYDMAFNLGVSGLLRFRRTLAAVQREDYEAAAVGMLASRWRRQVGRRAERLAEMMRTGEEQPLLEHA